MIYNFLLAAILIVAFFMCVKAYCLGLKHGKQLVNNEVPKQLILSELIGTKDPLAFFKDNKGLVEEVKEEKKIEVEAQYNWNE